MNMRHFGGCHGEIQKLGPYLFEAYNLRGGGRTYTLKHFLFRVDHPGTSPFQYTKNRK